MPFNQATWFMQRGTLGNQLVELEENLQIHILFGIFESNLLNSSGCQICGENI